MDRLQGTADSGKLGGAARICAATRLLTGVFEFVARSGETVQPARLLRLRFAVLFSALSPQPFGTVATAQTVDRTAAD